MLLPGDEVVDLQQVDPAEPLELPAVVRLRLSTLLDQTLVATNASARRAARAPASTTSARPYIGDESTTRTPASYAAATTASATGCSPGARSNTRHVPNPTTGTAMPVEPRGRVGSEPGVSVTPRPSAVPVPSAPRALEQALVRHPQDLDLTRRRRASTESPSSATSRRSAPRHSARTSAMVNTFVERFVVGRSTG